MGLGRKDGKEQGSFGGEQGWKPYVSRRRLSQVIQVLNGIILSHYFAF